MEWDVFLCASLFCFLSLYLILRPSTYSCKSIFSHFSRLKSIIYFTYGPLPSLSLLVQPVLREDQNHHLKTSIWPSPHSGGTWTLKSWDSSIWGRLLLQSEKKQELTGHHRSIWDIHLFQIFFFFLSCIFLDLLCSLDFLPPYLFYLLVLLSWSGSWLIILIGISPFFFFFPQEQCFSI